MSRRKAIRYTLVCTVLLLDVSLGLSLFSIKTGNDKMRIAYLERAYSIYSNEIYPVIEEIDLQELQANTSDGIISFQESLGLNSLCGSPGELFGISVSGDTNLYLFCYSLVNRLYLIIDPDSYTGPPYDMWKDIPAEESLQRIKRKNQEAKATLDEELEKGNGYIAAFEAVEPLLPTGLVGEWT